ncbi:MAG: ArgR family transcriptional regulator [Limosilactobacillus sp.]|uniref:arginine repressor n=1 Tax=Limosilactobacillus sp. TaxID=2773925 RepID=UPI002703E0B7|nr:ArgR family transcriptional regulator [Limosilactobacillus sp.]
MRKADRQRKIHEIITTYSIDRQEDLVAKLNEAGLAVTQATISRDINDMQLIKVPDDEGGYRYAMPASREKNQAEELAKALHHCLLELKLSDRFIAIDVRPGNGPVVANLLRQLEDERIFTTIGDDSNVLVVCDSAKSAKELEQYFSEIAE